MTHVERFTRNFFHLLGLFFPNPVPKLPIWTRDPPWIERIAMATNPNNVTKNNRMAAGESLKWEYNIYSAFIGAHIHRCMHKSLSVHPSVRPSDCLSIRLSVCPSVCLSVCLSACPSVLLWSPAFPHKHEELRRLKLFKSEIFNKSRFVERTQ